MGLDKLLGATAHLCAPLNLDLFRRNIDPEWIERALLATGTATLRKRRLPAEQVVWVVLGMALFRDRPLEDVVSKLELALPSSGKTVARSSIAQARKKLGSEPLRWLFELCSEEWSQQSANDHQWRGMSVYAIDGTSFRVPDSEANRATFGGHRARNGTHSAYPMVRMASLMVVSSHVLVGASFGAYEGTQELLFARPLLERIPEDSLTILDRGFFGAPFLKAIENGRNRNWLVRGRTNMSVRVVKKLGPRDEVVEFKTSHHALEQEPSLPKTFLARRINYKKTGFDRVILLTSLFDAEQYPRDELIELYHQRWEIELAYDEIKTELLEREEAIRSKTPDGVRQEIWGILLVYNLIRVEMERTAREAKVEPSRISFIESLRLIRDEWMWLAVTQSPGSIPGKLRELRANIKRYILPPRRTKRRHPRAVKIKMSNYPRKKPLSELK
jgi:Insertion element 4 transposase N-terminal/Transposase DDE domain